jgi:hypothetical protein
MKKPNVELLFPTPVLFSSLERDFTQEEMDFFKTQENHQSNNQGNIRSTNGYILEHKNMISLKSFCLDIVNCYIDNVIKPRYAIYPFITQSWLNWTKEGQYHHIHEHPNSYLSGVLYINADRSEDKIYFYNGAYRQIRIESDKLDHLNSRSWWYEVQSKDIVLFPSNLSHNVETIKHKNTRLSLAFNVFLKGTFGDEKELTEMIL